MKGVSKKSYPKWKWIDLDLALTWLTILAESTYGLTRSEAKGKQLAADESELPYPFQVT